MTLVADVKKYLIFLLLALAYMACADNRFPLNPGFLLTVRDAEAQGTPSPGGIILSEGWEANNFNNWNADWVPGATIDPSPVHSGQYAMKMHTETGGRPVHIFGDHPMLSNPGSMVTDVTVEAFVYPQPGWLWPSTNMKLWLMNCFESWSAGYSLSTGRSKPNPWAPYYFMVGILGNGYPYGELVRADGLGGVGELWGRYAQNQGSPVAFQIGTWNKLKYRLKLNTLGQNDGIFQLWINDVLKCEYINMNFRGTYSLYGWNHLIITTIGQPVQPQVQWIAYDDITIISGSAIPPNSPTIIQVK